MSGADAPEEEDSLVPCEEPLIAAEVLSPAPVGASSPRGRQTAPEVQPAGPVATKRMEFRISTPSPQTTPRQLTPGALPGVLGAVAGVEARLTATVAELRRQSELERRCLQQQIRGLDRRLQEQLGGSGQGQKQWADIQGSMSGMLLEMAAFGRRIDGMDEKLQLRMLNCEEVMRGRMRQLEQQLCAQQHKSLLASATSEAMSKRHTSRLWRALQSLEEQASRLTAVEEKASAVADAAHLEARINELEGKQARLESDLQSLVTTDMGLRSETTGSLVPTALAEATACGDTANGEHDSCSGDDYASTLRSLESDVSGLAKRTVGQLDSHAAALANLRIRSEGQEQRLIAVAERLETAISPPLNALRAEMSQLRDHDRQESEARLKDLARRLKSMEDTGEEVASELQERIRDLNTEMRSCEPRFQEDHPAIRQLADTTAFQAQALRRLEAAVAEPCRSPALPPEITGIWVRMDSIELRMESLEHGGAEGGLTMKADRADLARLDATVRELSEPVRRLSQRAASVEANTTTLERRLEQLSLMQESRSMEDAHRSLEDCPGPVTAAKVQEIADLKARIVDIEGLLEGVDLARGGLLGPMGRIPAAGLGLARNINFSRAGHDAVHDAGTATDRKSVV